jgi:hypothetical protein
MNKITLICIGLFSFGTIRVNAQFVDAPAMQHYYNFSAKDTNSLLLDFWNESFLKNTEYFGPITHGMTLFGDDINAQLGWVPDKHVEILGGAYIRKDFGNDALEIAQPTWTVKLQDGKGISFIFGNLEGAMDHRYIQPIYQCLFPNTYYKEQYFNPIETGVQLKIDKPWLWFDAWIDWAHQEYLNSDYHEHILQGISAELPIIHSENFKMVIPAQYTLFHYGGQIDTVGTPYTTIFNGATGLCFYWDFSKKNSFISNVKFENYACDFNDLSINPGKDIHIYPYTQGNGYMFNLSAQCKYGFGIMASYWDGIDYAAPIGGDLYQSVSWVYQSYHEDNRSLLFVRFFYQKELFPNFYVDLRLEPYRDLNLGFTEYAYYAFFTYKRTFTLTKVHLPKFNDSEYSH